MGKSGEEADIAALQTGVGDSGPSPSADDLKFDPAASAPPHVGEPGAAVLGGVIVGFILLCWAMLAIGDAPIPILHDMAEAAAWGREFQLGYHQHPPFWAWVCGAWFLVFPRAVWSFAALDALNAGIGLAGAWALIGDFARGPRRVAGFALLALTPIYTLGAYKYDANTIFLSLWPWMTHAFVRAMRTRRMGWALGFGALAGLACLSKYFALLPLLACGLGALATREGRAYLRSASPWLSMATAAVVFAPHALWLAETGAPPLRYFNSVSGLDWGTVARGALACASWTALCFVGVGAVVVVFARRGRAPAPRGDAARLLSILALWPLLLTLAAGVALRVRLTPEMPVGVLALIPLWGISRLADTQALARFAWRAGVAATLAMAVLSPLVMVLRTYVGKGAAAVAPYPEAAEAVTRAWRERFGGPLEYVAGMEYAHQIAFYSPDRPHAFFRFDPYANLWVTPEKLAARGWAAVCAEADAECIANAQAMAGATTQRFELTG